MKLSPAAVLGPWAWGILVSSWLVRRWRAVKPSFHGTMCLTAAAIMGLLAYVGERGLGAGSRAIWLLANIVVAIAAGAAGMFYWFDTRFPLRVADALQVSALVVSAVVTVVHSIGTVPSSAADLALARAMTAMLFLGSATGTMVLGHWYLVDPRLDRRAIGRLGGLMLLSLPAEVAALMLAPGMAEVWSRQPTAFVDVYLPKFWLANLVATALFGAGVLVSLRAKGYSGVMAATGLSYLAILTAFGVDVLAKALIGALG